MVPDAGALSTLAERVAASMVDATMTGLKAALNTLLTLDQEIPMSNEKNEKFIERNVNDLRNQGDPLPPGGVGSLPITTTVGAATPGKALERLDLAIEFFTAMDPSQIAALLDEVKKFGIVTKATHKVLRAHKRELI